MTFAKSRYDAIVIGSGPNGLACAIELSRQGFSTVVIEKSDSVGGCLQTRELTAPGFHHDVFSAVHPMGFASPFFASLPLAQYGFKWGFSESAAAHPFEDGDCVLLKNSIAETAQQFHQGAKSYQEFFEPMLDNIQPLVHEFLTPFPHRPSSWAVFRDFNLNALRPATVFAKKKFPESAAAQALFMGIAAHSSMPLTHWASTAVGLSLQALGHAGGWPFPLGGAAQLAAALTAHFVSLGGEVMTNFEVKSLASLPQSRWIFFDLTPRQVLLIANESLTSHVRTSLQRYRYGPAVYKIDWALAAPIPWQNEKCRQAATVHLGATTEEIVCSEEAVAKGHVSARPFVLLTQPSLWDAQRAPTPYHTAWAYCHVPNGSNVDASVLIENQIERFAPGFKKIILHRSCLSPRDLEARNPNLIGGDIHGGLLNLRQLLFRPRISLRPYSLGNPKLWLCSSATPPGSGVHGMCGVHAAHAAIATL